MTGVLVAAILPAAALASPAPSAASHALGRSAVEALHDELALAPKPGLVSFDANDEVRLGRGAACWLDRVCGRQ